MNVNTGHLVNNEMLQIMRESFPQEDYTPVPQELESAAAKKLDGKPEAFVSLTSGGKLSSWAREQRKKKRKMVNESRRRNRHG